jgi:hypothetical protein
MSYCPSNAPTVRMVVSVPAPLRGGNGWGWAPHPQGNPAGFDYIDNCAEMIKAFRVWGTFAARVLIRKSHDRFNVSAYNEETGRLMARDTWQRSPETGILRPHGQPMCVCGAPPIDAARLGFAS